MGAHGVIAGGEAGIGAAVDQLEGASCRRGAGHEFVLDVGERRQRHRNADVEGHLVVGHGGVDGERCAAGLHMVGGEEVAEDLEGLAHLLPDVVRVPAWMCG